MSKSIESFMVVENGIVNIEKTIENFRNSILSALADGKVLSRERIKEEISKKYIATVYSRSGEYLESKNFDSSVTAENYIDNKIIESLDNYGIISHSDSERQLSIRVNRNDSIRRLWCSKSGQSLKRKAIGGNWKKMKVSNDKFYFSRG